jgi:phosphoglucomutase
LAGVESAGASFLRRDGTVWTTDKDGFILDLLAAEILAVTGRDPGEHYRALEAQFGQAVYERMDAPANPAQKALGSLAPEWSAPKPWLDPITAALCPRQWCCHRRLKVVTANGWFAAALQAPR